MKQLESIILEIWSYGYSLKIEGENIRFHHFGTSLPARERFTYLIGEIKKNKATAIAYIKKTLEDINNGND